MRRKDSRWFVVALALIAVIAPTTSDARKTRYSQSHITGGSDCYVAKSGNCVRRPARAPSAPSGASAKCRDGSWSFSESRRGTCSRHGGVARWL